MIQRTVASTIASTMVAYNNCVKSGNSEWEQNHREKLEYIERNILPCGSGIDCGTRIDWEKTKGDKIVLTTDYHMMDEHGYYCGWIENIRITITPSFNGINIKIYGTFSKYKIGEALKDYLHEVFYDYLTQIYKESEE